MDWFFSGCANLHSKNGSVVSLLQDTTKCQSTSHCQHGRIVQLQKEDENSANGFMLTSVVGELHLLVLVIYLFFRATLPTPTSWLKTRWNKDSIFFQGWEANVLRY